MNLRNYPIFFIIVVQWSFLFCAMQEQQSAFPTLKILCIQVIQKQNGQWHEELDQEAKMCNAAEKMDDVIQKGSKKGWDIGKTLWGRKGYGLPQDQIYLMKSINDSLKNNETTTWKNRVSACLDYKEYKNIESQYDIYEKKYPGNGRKRFIFCPKKESSYGIAQLLLVE